MDKQTQLLLERLEAVLLQAVERQRQIIGLLERKRLALRSGDTAAMENLCRTETSLVQTVAEIEQRRQQMVEALTQRIAPDATEPMRMKDLAECLPEPWRGRLLVTRTQLIETMQQVQQHTAVARRASEALLGHVNGLMRTIGSAARGGAAYVPTGRLQTRTTTLSTINLTA